LCELLSVQFSFFEKYGFVQAVGLWA